MRESEYYRSEIIRMVEKITDNLMLYKIYSFVRVFYNRRK
jgi:hypothetical protein